MKTTTIEQPPLRPASLACREQAAIRIEVRNACHQLIRLLDTMGTADSRTRCEMDRVRIRINKILL